MIRAATPQTSVPESVKYFFGLPVMTLLSRLYRHDKMFHVEHFSVLHALKLMKVATRLDPSTVIVRS